MKTDIQFDAQEAATLIAKQKRQRWLSTVLYHGLLMKTDIQLDTQEVLIASTLIANQK